MTRPSLPEAIDAVAVVVQDLVDAEFANAGVVVPGSALDQVGLKNGLSLVRDYLRNGELGVALDHVLYIIRELDLILPADTYAMLRSTAGEMKLGETELAGVKVASV